MIDWPGRPGTRVPDFSTHQVIEHEYMSQDEYPEFINDFIEENGIAAEEITKMLSQNNLLTRMTEFVTDAVPKMLSIHINLVRPYWTSC